MAGVEGQRADRVALRVGHLADADHARRVAGARRGNRAVEGHVGAVRSVTTGGAGVERDGL